MHYWAYGLATVGQSWVEFLPLKERPMCRPHPFLRYSLRGNKYGQRWASQPVFEHEKEGGGYYAHVHFVAIQSFNGKDGSMTFGELALILKAMQNRAKQLTGDGDEEDGDKFHFPDPDPDEIVFEFEDEKRFPVLMLSWALSVDASPTLAWMMKHWLSDSLNFTALRKVIARLGISSPVFCVVLQRKRASLLLIATLENPYQRRIAK